MRNKKRIHDEAAYVLHQRDFSETSQILDVFTRHHGRISLLAKGVKRPMSSFRAVLLPLQAVRIGFSLSTDKETLAVLQGVEWAGHAPMPAGPSLLAGLYLNELILKLLAKEDPHSDLFDAFHQAVQGLDTGVSGAQPQVLRIFELQLLQALGFLPNLAHLANSRQTLIPNAHYRLQAAHGLVLVETDAVQNTRQNTKRLEQAALTGAHWNALAQALSLPDPEANRQALQHALSAFSRSALRGLRIQLGEAISHCLQQYQIGKVSSDEAALAAAESEANSTHSATETKHTNHVNNPSKSNTGLNTVYRLRTRQLILDLQKLQNNTPPPVGHI